MIKGCPSFFRAQEELFKEKLRERRAKPLTKTSFQRTLCASLPRANQDREKERQGGST